METAAQKRKQTQVESAPAGKSAKTESGAVAGSNEYKTDPQFLVSLIHTTCDQLRVPQNTVFIAERTDKIVDVFRGLIKHNFLSVPVLQKTGWKWYGFLDMADIVSYVVELFGATKLQTAEDFWSLFDKEEAFRNKTVNDFMKHPLSRRNPFHPVKTGYSLYFVIEALAREHDLHRVPIIDNERQLMNLITQSQVVRFLYENLDKIGNKTKMPVNLINNVLKDVVSISESQPAIDAFSLMVKENVSGIAVVDESGKLTGNLSVRDLKAMAPDSGLFWRLYKPTKEFISKLNKEHATTRPRSAQHCTVDDTVESVITKLTEHRIHRLFIVNSHHQPIGVISLKDILLEIIS